jgi:SAM-dependent methyltransferase
VTLNDPALVQREYASEAGLEARRSIYIDAEGPDARAEAFRAVAEAEPRSVLEVGCGLGELAQRIRGELGADVTAIDVSPRMVELARARGVDARLGDVQALPFADETFDCVVAAWMLYHVPDLDRGLAEIARVLKPGGRLVAATNSERHLDEARAVAGIDMRGRVTFSRENGEVALLRHFARLERRDLDGWVTFPDGEALRSYIRTLVTMRDRADHVPDFEKPLRAGTRVGIFVAEKTV